MRHIHLLQGCWPRVLITGEFEKKNKRFAGWNQRSKSASSWLLNDWGNQQVKVDFARFKGLARELRGARPPAFWPRNCPLAGVWPRLETCSACGRGSPAGASGKTPPPLRAAARRFFCCKCAGRPRGSMGKTRN